MLQPYKLNVVGPNNEIRKQTVDTGNADAISVGDAVTVEADGNVAKLWGNSGAPDNALAFAGVVQAILENESATRTAHFPNTLPASTAGTLSVVIDPMATFAITAVNAVLSTTHIGANCNLVDSGNLQLDLAQVDATADRQFKIVDVLVQLSTGTKFAIVRPGKHNLLRAAGI